LNELTATIQRPTVRFSLEDTIAAGDEWNFNCGPAALCAIFDLLPSEIRPHLGDFERKGYTNPTLMEEITNRISRSESLRPIVKLYRGDTLESWERKHPSDNRWPDFGLVRLQWGGPWTNQGVPMRVRYRKTHWVAMKRTSNGMYVFDVNAMCEGGWIQFGEWSLQLVPWLIKACEPKASGEWWPTHSWSICQ
jgi:hypothetical protein